MANVVKACFHGPRRV